MVLDKNGCARQSRRSSNAAQLQEKYNSLQPDGSTNDTDAPCLDFPHPLLHTLRMPFQLFQLLLRLVPLRYKFHFEQLQRLERALGLLAKRIAQ